MTDRLSYWFDLLLTACGLDGAGDNLLFGLIVVLTAAVALVYAAYRALTATLWPGETDPYHIKHRVIRDGKDIDAR